MTREIGHMINNRNFLMCVVLCFTAACIMTPVPVMATTLEAATTLTLATNGKTLTCISLADSASLPEKTAAHELAAYLKKVTGAEFPIVKPADVDGRLLIAVGPGAARALDPDLDLVKAGDKGLGEDGIIQKAIQSDAADHGTSLILTGAEGSKRGTLYAVYEFLEREVGVRWWTHTEEFVPDRPTLRVRSLNVRYKPPFFFREVYSWGMVHIGTTWGHDDSDIAVQDWAKAKFAARLRNNGAGTVLPASLGGCLVAMGRGHTFDPFLPSEKYFKEHPEWYSERGGKRVGHNAQLCMTNDEMLKELSRNILIKIREKPHLGMVHVSQNDNQAVCQCAKCMALDDAEGSTAASTLYGVNKVAEAIEKEFPDFHIVTFAYQYTRKPPKTLRPRQNVLVQFCVIERTGTQPIDSEENRSLMNDLKGWAAAAPKLLIWDYTMNMSGPMAPHPNWPVFGPDFRTYRDNHAAGVFCESESVGITDFVALKVYLMAHLLWDPSRDEKMIMDEFLVGYYGKAGPLVKQVLDGFEKLGSKVRMHAYSEGPYASWLDLESMNRATELFQEAEVAVAEDPFVLARVKRARISLDHQWLRGYAGYREQAKNKGVQFLGPQDPAKGAADFSAYVRGEIAAAPKDYQKCHMPLIVQFQFMNKTFDAYLNELTQLATKGKCGALPACLSDIPPSQIITMDHTLASVLQNNGAEVVVDAKSTSGLSMKVPKAAVPNWAVQALTKRFSSLGGFGRYRVYAVVRCDLKTDKGAAFVGGVWDNRNRKGLGSFSFPIGKPAAPLAAKENDLNPQFTFAPITNGKPVTDGEYHVYDFGAYDFSHADMLVWVGTTTGDMYVERFVFVREDVQRESRVIQETAKTDQASPAVGRWANGGQAPRPGPFRLEALVDFVDDAIAAPQALTPGHIDSLMVRLAALGVCRVGWGYYGDGHGGWLMPAAYTEDYQGGWRRCADTYLNLGNPLRVAVEAGHRYGLEVYAYFKPYETGAGMLFPEGSPQAKTMGLLPHLGGQLAWMEPFVRDNPTLRLRRRDDCATGTLDTAIRTIRLIKQDALPTRITREHVQVWTSPDNWRYQRTAVEFTLSQTVESAPHEVRDHEGKLLTRQGEDVRVLTLAGLDLKEKYVLVTTDFTDGTADFSNAGTAILTAHDAAGREIAGVFATGGTVWTASLVNFREGGLTFDYGWGAKLVTLDAPNVSGKSGFIAFTRGRNAYLPGSLCESEPRVQEFWLTCLEEMIAAGVDGVDFREESHSSHTDTPEDYGFNEVVLQQCGDLQGVDLVAKIRDVRGQAYTEFLRKCKTRLASSGRRMRYNLQLDFFRPDPPADRLLAYPANINFDWQRWLDESLMDEAILRFYKLPFEAVFEDPVAEAMIGRCQQRGIPVVVNRYVGSAGDQLPQEVACVRADARFNGFILYETADFIGFNAAGGCFLKLPVVEEAVKQLRVGAARANMISIDFNNVDFSGTARTASGTVTDVNGHASLPGQVGLWNELLIGKPTGGQNQPTCTNAYTIGSLKDGSGTVTGVSFTFNTNNLAHYVYFDSTAGGNVLQRDWMGADIGQGPLNWRLSGLETGTVYRLRMFGREHSGLPGTPGSFARFTATGTKSDDAYCQKNYNYADLWVKSTAGGVISGTVANMDGVAGFWSGMQIEWNVAPPVPVVSIDFKNANPAWQGLPASGTVVDTNAYESMPGQVGPWNVLGMGTTNGGSTQLAVSTKHTISGLQDGEGNATTVSFTFNISNNTYVVYTGTHAEPRSTALHRDVCYPAPISSPVHWRLAGLQASKAYTLKFFGIQDTVGPRLFANFSATGLNTAAGGTSLGHNFVDLVVTATANGQITGTVTNQAGQAAGTWSGIQVQGPKPFLRARDLISIDFQTADVSNQNSTASGTMTDVNGHTSFGQAGVWNQLLSGINGGGYFQFTTQQPSISGLLDGEGNATTVAFQFNTGTPIVSYYTFGLPGNVLYNNLIGIVSNAVEAAWKITGLQPCRYYTLRMFGQQSGSVPSNFAKFTASGMGTDIGSTSSATNYVDLTVPATAAGQITGKLVWIGAGASGSSWSGMQILKGVPWEPTGTVIKLLMRARKLSDRRGTCKTPTDEAVGVAPDPPFSCTRGCFADGSGFASAFSAKNSGQEEFCNGTAIRI